MRTECQPGDVALPYRLHGCLSGVRFGVEQAELSLLLQPFCTFAMHPGRAASGTGLGLAIPRSVHRAHGGTVSADSAGRGQGMRPKFVLPVVLDATVA